MRAVSTLCVLFLIVAPRPQAQDDAPVIEAIEPMLVCQGCVMQVVGSRLVGDDMDGTRVRLVRGQQIVTLKPNSFSRTLDEKPSARGEALTFGVPSDAMTGSWQLIVERAGRPSAPVTFEVFDWVPLTLHALSLEEVAPGQRLTLTGGSLPPQLFVDVLDQNGGRLSRTETGAGPREIGFYLPEQTPEGDMLVRIGANKDGREWHSQSLPLKVTALPIPSIEARMMAPVAPGQWTTLVLDLNGHRIAAQRVEVEFRQGPAVAVSGHNWDPNTRRDPNDRIRIRIPPTLAPGLVSLRARLWRASRASPWSQPVEFDLLPIPADAVIHAIAAVRDENPFAVWFRRDASPPLEVRAGDHLLVGGEFPFASPRVTLTAHTSPNAPVSLPILKDQGHLVDVEVPQLAAGEWTLHVQSDDAVTPGGAGVVIRVEK